MTDLELAIFNLRANAARYDKPDRYYRGDHDLAFATEKFENAFGDLFREFALNLCPSICDAVRDKLKINGFTLGTRGPRTPSSARVASDAQAETRAGAPARASREAYRVSASVFYHPQPETEQQLTRLKSNEKGSHSSPSSLLPSSSSPRLGVSAVHSDIHESIDALWSDNRMDLVAEELHLEALKLGDSYAIVWPDETGRVTIYPQRAALCTVRYDDERPGHMLWAAKYWRVFDDFRIRLNLFYPDRVEKYISRTGCELSIPDASAFALADAFDDNSVSSSLPTAARQLPTVVPNPYGQVPVFHFSNTSEIGTFGKSELSQAIPIQNGLNKAVLDMLVAMEFSAFRQRWVSGIEIEYDESGEPIPPFKCGMDRIWMTSNAETTFGDFNTTDLDQFLKVKDSFRIDMAGVTGTPLHYFLQNERGFASAEALARAEARFLAKIRDRQKIFGQTWSDLMSFAVRVAGAPAGIRLLPQWLDPAPIAERELLENLVLKKKLGITTEQALVEAGYGRSDISRMLEPTPDVRTPSPAAKRRKNFSFTRKRVESFDKKTQARIAGDTVHKPDT